MFKGTLEAQNILEENVHRPLLYIFDPDVDGLISGFLFCFYLEAMGLDYSYYINDNRKHGFLLDLDKLEGYLVICADFSIYDEIIEEIKKRDIALICIDHHKIDGEFRVWDKGVIINNQYHFEPEEKKYLSGAGVVFEVLCEWNSMFDTIENRALVGITLLSDVRPIESKEAQEYLECTFSRDNSEGYFKYLIDNTIKSDFGFGIPKMDRNFVDFAFSPRINSMLRFNESIEAVDFILGRGMKVEDKRELQKDYTQYLLEKASITELTHMYLVSIKKEDLTDYTYIEPSNFIGLACSKVKDRGKCTVIVLTENEKLVRGSFRGRYDGIDYLTFFRENGSVAFGHDPAFGIHEIDLSEVGISKLNNGIGALEKGFKSTIKIIEVENLSFFCINKARKIATKNNFVRDAFRTYVRYKGENINRIRGNDNYIEYLVDGNTVKSFDVKLDVRDALILPITEKGYVNLYLRNIVY